MNCSMVKVFQIILLIGFSNLFGQNNLQKIDSIATSTKYNGNLNQLVENLIENLDNDLDKTRVIYSWIVENIGYDYKLYNKGKRTIKFKCKNKTDCHNKRLEFENKLAETVLRKQKGVCSGYSALFKRMCDFAKVKALIIDGYVKTKSYHVGNAGILDHSWNAVIIDNQTYFLDLTWASGYCDSNKNGKLTNFTKKRNDFYWFTPVEKFTIDHFPEKPSKIQNFNISKDEYKNQPYIKTDIIPFIEIESPKQGIINTKVNDTIIFKFKYSETIGKLQINTNLKRNPKFQYINKEGKLIFNQKAYDKQDFIIFKKQNDSYEFSYFVESKDLKYIEILFDYELKLKYLIQIE